MAIPGDDLTRLFRRRDGMRGQQPPLQRLDAWRRIDLGDIDHEQVNTRRQVLARRCRTAQRHCAEPQRQAGRARLASGLFGHHDRLAMPLRPGSDGCEQPPGLGQAAVVGCTGQQLHTLRATGELLVDVALAIGDHGDACSSCQHLGGFVGGKQPAIGLLVLDPPLFEAVHLGVRAVENLRTDQADHAAMDGIHRDGWMQEQPEITVVAGSPKAGLAGSMAGEVELRRVLDRQHVPPGRTLAGEPPGRGQHLVSADAGVVEETAKGQRLVAVFRQRMQAGRRLLTHGLQQTRANAAKTRITEPTKIFLNHEADLLPILRATGSQLRSKRKSFRTYANPVGRLRSVATVPPQASFRKDTPTV